LAFSVIDRTGADPYTARPFRVSQPLAQSHMEQSLPQELVKQVGGSFRLTALLQKRVRELVRGQKPLFETRERNYIKIASEELKRGLIELVADEEQTGPTKVEV
jgi:DNA-directed RNA polymerase subunit K/omega